MRNWYIAQSLDPVKFDAKDGIGAVPHNQDIDYFGFIVPMTPDKFLSLASSLQMNSTSTGIEEMIRAGEAVGPPFFNVEWNDQLHKWKIMSHEGRNRAIAIRNIDPNTIMPVHIFPHGFRARHLIEEMKNAPLIAEWDKASLFVNWYKLSQSEYLSPDPSSLGYQKEWGEHHSPISFKPDYWNYGSQGYNDRSPPWPLPKKLYHVTLNPEKIIQEGFKTFKEPGEQTFGGHGQYVSFTILSNAQLYAEGLKDMIKAANGDYLITDILKLVDKWKVKQSTLSMAIDQALSNIFNASLRKHRGDFKKLVELVGNNTELESLTIVTILGTFWMGEGGFPLFMVGGNEVIYEKFRKYLPEDVAILEVETPVNLKWRSDVNIFDEDMSSRYTVNKGENEWRVWGPQHIDKAKIKRIAFVNWYKKAARKLDIRESLRIFGFDNTPSSSDEVKKKYRQLAMKHHPDRGGNIQQMDLINEAYNALNGINWSTYSEETGEEFSRSNWQAWDAARARNAPPRDVPEWETDPRASFYYTVGEDFRNLNYSKKTIYEEAIKHGDVQPITFWAFDGSFSRGVFTAKANKQTLGFAAEAMRIWNSEGPNSYKTEAVLATGHLPSNLVQIIWLKGQNVVDKNIILQNESFNANPFNDQSFLNKLRDFVAKSGVDIVA